MRDSEQAFPDWLSSRAAATPTRPALIVGTKTWTFRELDADATRVAMFLAVHGVRAGDRIATVLHNGWIAAILPHATLRLGAILVPLNVRLTSSELEWQINDARPRVVIAEARTLDSVRNATGALGEVEILMVDALGESQADAVAKETLKLSHDADAVLAIIYTSGTTGRPKGVKLTVGNFWWSAIGSALNLGTDPGDRWLACLPLFHIGGLSILIRSAIYGIGAVVHERFDPLEVNAAIDEGGVSIISLVAVMLERTLDARGDRPFPATLRCILLGGGPASAALVERCANAGAPAVQTYGLTETCSQVATIAPGEAHRKPGSVGKALYPNELSILTDEADSVGEILVRGPVVMAGYAGMGEETNRILVDGWLHTGDVGRLDDEGYLYVIDRRDDLIVTGGENVYPAEVEVVLAAHPAIDEVAVIGIPDPEWGQRVIAIAHVTGEQPDAETLDAYCRQRLAGYKVPSEFRFTPEPLPRTASGKLRRSDLKMTAVQK